MGAEEPPGMDALQAVQLEIDDILVSVMPWTEAIEKVTWLKTLVELAEETEATGTALVGTRLEALRARLAKAEEYAQGLGEQYQDRAIDLQFWLEKKANLEEGA
jgi:hypothetical protein